MTNTAQGYSPPPAQSRNPYENNDFSYAFPKFGDFSGSFASNGSRASSNTNQPAVSSTSPGASRQPSGGTISPANTNGNFNVPQTASPQSFTQFNDTSLNELTGLFSPEILRSASRSNSTDYNFPSTSSLSGSNKNDGSFSNGATNGSQQKPHRASSASTVNSPASSVPFDSSVGTTPEPTGENAASPDNTTAKVNTPSSFLRTINENSAPAAIQSPLTPSDPLNSFDWMAAQNGGSFDPVLYGDYRDPQDNILNSLGDDFFNDAMGVRADFSTPYNTGDLMPSEPKRDLMKEIEAEASAYKGLAKADDPNATYMGYDKVWYVWRSSGALLLPTSPEFFSIKVPGPSR